MVKWKNVEAIQEMLAKAGVEYAVFEGVTGEPKDKMVEAADRFAVLAKAIGAAGEEETDPEAAEKFIRACRELCKFCHIPTLEEYGIDREAFLEKIPKMTRDALASGSPANTRKELCEEDIAAIYKSLLVHPLNTN